VCTRVKKENIKMPCIELPKHFSIIERAKRVIFLPIIEKCFGNIIITIKKARDMENALNALLEGREKPPFRAFFLELKARGLPAPLA
jgi:hypothetical protein